jgi:hypothetical protein
MRESQGASAVLQRLAQSRSPLNAETVHIGWGSFRNLDIAAARKSTWVLLLDINIYQLKVWEAVAKALLQAEVDTPAAFIDAVIPYLPRVPRLRQFAESTRDWLLSDLERQGSWLCEATPDRFAYVRDLFRNNRLNVGCLDLRAGRVSEESPFEEMYRLMLLARVNHQITFDTLYVSNIPWMLAQPVGFFGESHQSQMGETNEPVLGRVHHNLSRITPVFQQVISAAQLAANAVSEDLQWETQLLEPADFLSEQYWKSLGLKPGDSGALCK